MSNLQSGQVSERLDPLLKRPSKAVCRRCTSCPSNQVMQVKGHARVETPYWSSCVPRPLQPVRKLWRTNEVMRRDSRRCSWCWHDHLCIVGLARDSYFWAAWAATHVSSHEHGWGGLSVIPIVHETTLYSNSCRSMGVAACSGGWSRKQPIFTHHANHHVSLQNELAHVTGRHQRPQ